MADFTAEQIRSMFDYDPETGIFRWKKRGDKPAWWNKRYVGKIAGTRWSNPHRKTVYQNISINDRGYRAHRLAWLYVHGEWPPIGLDHINGDGLDNRIANLRLATPQQNGANRPSQKNNTTGLKGVKRARRGRFSARIKHDGITYHLGIFDTPEEANAAYLAAARERFGEFARAT